MSSHRILKTERSWLYNYCLQSNHIILSHQTPQKYKNILQSLAWQHQRLAWAAQMSPWAGEEGAPDTPLGRGQPPQMPPRAGGWPPQIAPWAGGASTQISPSAGGDYGPLNIKRYYVVPTPQNRCRSLNIKRY